MIKTILILLLTTTALRAGPVPENTLLDMRAAPVVILGEVHDNPAHHAHQAELVRLLTPRAIVFEMLTQAQAALATDAARQDQAALNTALDWDHSGWPDFAMYYPLFTGAPRAHIYGAALPRGDARKALKAGAAQHFGEDARFYGLADPLPSDQQTAREALQAAAHCDALPEEMLPGMIELQRLRDAMLARMVTRALAETGGPVVLITGNGHARRDWGVPEFLTRTMPSAFVFVLGQTEDGAPLDGGFDHTLSAPAVPREDPCNAFR